MLFISALAVFAVVAGASAKEDGMGGGFAYAVDGIYTNVRVDRVASQADPAVPGVPQGQDRRQHVLARPGRLLGQDRARGLHVCVFDVSCPADERRHHRR